VHKYLVKHVVDALITDNLDRRYRLHLHPDTAALNPAKNRSYLSLYLTTRSKSLKTICAW
jgi:hypothetical protein